MVDSRVFARIAAGHFAENFFHKLVMIMRHHCTDNYGTHILLRGRLACKLTLTHLFARGGKANGEHNPETG